MCVLIALISLRVKWLMDGGQQKDSERMVDKQGKITTGLNNYCIMMLIQRIGREIVL